MNEQMELQFNVSYHAGFSEPGSPHPYNYNQKNSNLSFHFFASFSEIHAPYQHMMGRIHGRIWFESNWKRDEQTKDMKQSAKENISLVLSERTKYVQINIRSQIEPFEIIVLTDIIIVAIINSNGCT